MTFRYSAWKEPLTEKNLVVVRKKGRKENVETERLNIFTASSIFYGKMCSLSVLFLFRGEEGDCRDPFYLSTNSTLLESRVSGVEMPPCASGWCSKIIEGLDNLVRRPKF